MRFRSAALLAILFSLAATARVNASDTTFHFQGTIGDHLLVNLQLTGTPNGDQFSGFYRYANHGLQLDLTQVSNTDGEYLFSERAVREDKITGYLRGKFTGIYHDAFVGVWQSADKKQSLHFNLNKIAESVELIAARTDRYDVRVAYPKFTGASPFLAALNEEFRKRAEADFDRTVADFRKDTADADAGPLPYEFTSTVEVIQTSDRLVSVLHQDYSYTGGAHGNTGYSADNYGFRDGKLVQLDFAQLSGGRPKTRAKLNALCVKRLAEQGASWPNVKFDPKSDPIVNATTAGLIFTFGPYEAGSYAEGSYTTFIKFSEFAEPVASVEK